MAWEDRRGPLCTCSVYPWEAPLAEPEAFTGLSDLARHLVLAPHDLLACRQYEFSANPE